MNTPPPDQAVDVRESRFEWLRLGSALLVVLCHFAALYASFYHSFDADSATLDSAPPGIKVTLTALYFQFHGAYIFFAISGYVITKPWFAVARTPETASFLGRRAFRLLPAATVAIIAAACFDFYRLDFRQVDVATLLLNVLYLNWLPLYAAPPILIVTWTLAVEWLFYFTAPFVVRAVIRCERPILAVVCLAVLLGVALRTCTANAYAYPLYFAAGMVVAIRRTTQSRQPDHRRSLLLLVGGALTILLASLVYASQAPINWRPVQWPWRPFDTFVAIHLAGTTALVRWAAGPTRSAPRVKPLPARLPTLTYSIYLWHLPACLLVFAVESRGAAFAANSPELIRLSALLAVAILLTLALAMLSYLLAERPYFRWKQRRSSRGVSAKAR